MSIYFDHAACELPTEKVKDYCKSALDIAYNPSAIYKLAAYNKQVIENTREAIAEEINCSPEEIFFTSGASEANAMAIVGYLNDSNYNSVFCTPIEHSSIMDIYDHYWQIEPLITVDSNGFVDLENLEKLVDEGGGVNDVLWCIQHANNVIGCIQDIKKIRQILGPYEYLFVDAAQTFGKIKINVKEMGIDMLSASARKIGGIGGVGFLYINRDCEDMKLKPLITGPQEGGRRGGTYFDMGIGAFGVALSECDPKKQIKTRCLRDYLITEALKIDGVELIGTRANRLPGIALFKIKNVDLTSQQIVGLFDEHNIMISADSACHAGSPVFSHVLQAIGETPETAKCVIRVSLGHDNTADEVDRFIKVLAEIVRFHKCQ